MPLLLVLACACFVGSFSIRMIDPLVPVMAADLATDEANVSLLSSAFAISYAIVQPLLGPIGDRFGKARVIKLCLIGLLIATAITVVATSIEMMLFARIVGGLAGGGIIPLAFAVIGDRVPFERRQFALSQVVSASIIAILVSTVGTGLLASAIGWRSVFAIACVAIAVALTIALFSLNTDQKEPGQEEAAKRVDPMAAYRKVLSNPRAPICFVAVFCEGLLVLGILPFVATLLAARGEGGVFEAGLVLAGFAIGGLAYAQIGSRLIGRVGGVPNLIRIGAVFLALGFAGVALQGSWPFEAAAFVLFGIGFYAVHNSLQTEATELAPNNRGAAVGLFAFCFFIGQSIGPMLYAVALSTFDPAPVIAAVGVIAFGLSLLLSVLLRRDQVS